MVRVESSRVSLLDRIIDPLLDPSRRIGLLIVAAYVTGIAGVAMSLFGNAADPTAPYSAVGIGLMAISFVSLFVVSAVILDLGQERSR